MLLDNFTYNRAKELSREPLNSVDIELDSTHPFVKFIKDNIGKFTSTYGIIYIYISVKQNAKIIA
ncbi:MAG: hypothetical protein UR28_C0016G0007 [Candidatus Peregrinibacteria bacterium GW2011_GWF2_33_10]|nr:MAG: hypothetical protein UR28_C0016G0007 [Candidatus Peregrinibacteria bacterium GW2011_GWF2_33_10]OGJ46487.1 MAG: hypothetical protein A2272_03545 [Candidatus Peregrinibacteria bacterium RIFOXYA12_FULL_33_12]OGJ51364.1 MAG: hypothetical protein A2307_02325 [Candidatus Peregrinibacteria bacterium RIFOXYB2_FULL_33_20]